MTQKTPTKTETEVPGQSLVDFANNPTPEFDKLNKVFGKKQMPTELEMKTKIKKSPVDLKPKPDSEPPYFPSLLLYGTLGTGKTGFLGQSGGLLLDFDDGARTLKTMDDQYKESRLKMWTSRVNLYEADYQAPSSFSKFRTLIYNLKTLSRKKPLALPLVVGIDSLTGLAKAGMMSIQANSGNHGKNPQIQEWGILFNEIEVLLRIFRSLPCIKVLVAHERLDEVNGDTKIKLHCPGKKSGFDLSVAAFFDDVMYARVKSIGGGKHQHILTVTSTAAVACRTRTAFKGDWPLNDGFWSLMKKLGYER